MHNHKFTIIYSLPDFPEEEITEKFIVSLNTENKELATQLVTDFYKSKNIKTKILQFNIVEYIDHEITQGNSVLL